MQQSGSLLEVNVFSLATEDLSSTRPPQPNELLRVLCTTIPQNLRGPRKFRGTGVPPVRTARMAVPRWVAAPPRCALKASTQRTQLHSLASVFMLFLAAEITEALPALCA